MSDELNKAMDLMTKIAVEAPGFAIDHQTKMLMLGSCFVENIGSKLEHYKFQADINPFGIVYNPFSMANVLEFLVSGKRFTAEDLNEYQGKWFSFYHHGSFSDPEKDRCLEHINLRLEKASEELKRLDLLVMTWGTAWVYRHKVREIIVSNCHKIPEREFDRYRLEVSEIAERYTLLINQLRQLNPRLRILFTVSPIRHWKDGAHENQLSKATLLLAIAELRQRFEQVHYFPAYEIVLDELRDYRFYAPDMLHLTETTIAYIWERLSSSYISQESKSLIEQLERINKGIAHRPFNPHSPAYQQHLDKLLTETDRLSTLYPHLSFGKEKEQIDSLRSTYTNQEK